MNKQLSSQLDVHTGELSPYVADAWLEFIAPAATTKYLEQLFVAVGYKFPGCGRNLRKSPAGSSIVGLRIRKRKANHKSTGAGLQIFLTAL